jgi:hypothetical protein
MRCRLVVGCVLVVVLLCGSRDVGAVPLSVAYVDTVTGLEWAQVSETTGTAYWDARAIDGWTLATLRDVTELILHITGLSLAGGYVDPYYGDVFTMANAEEANSAWAPAFLDVFTPTVSTPEYRAVLGWVVDGSPMDRNAAYVPRVLDSAQGADTVSKNMIDTHTDYVSGRVPSAGTPDRGAWLYRQVPEPSTLLLLGLGGVLGALSRQRTRRRAS